MEFSNSVSFLASVKQVLATLVAKLWNKLFLATKSVSQLTSTIAAVRSSAVIAMTPCGVLLPATLCAVAHPRASACSLIHASAWNERTIKPEVINFSNAWEEMFLSLFVYGILIKKKNSSGIWGERPTKFKSQYFKIYPKLFQNSPTCNQFFWKSRK